MGLFDLVFGVIDVLDTNRPPASHRNIGAGWDNCIKDIGDLCKEDGMSSREAHTQANVV